MNLEKINTMIGKRVNNLTVLAFSHVKQGNAYWKCMCDCGNERIIPTQSLKINGTKSCGCVKILKHNKGDTGLKILYATYKSNARINERVFELTLGEFKDITSKKCFYCGTEPSSCCGKNLNHTNIELVSHPAYTYNGIDRVDSSKGYIKENVVPCCKWCNIAKSNKTVEEFKEHILRIYNHLKGDFHAVTSSV